MREDDGQVIAFRQRIESAFNTLTKREQFAMAAMQGIVSTLSNTQWGKAMESVANDKGWSMEKYMARQAVIQADALIAELNKEVANETR